MDEARSFLPHCPDEDCPPSDAAEPNETYYRLCKENPPSDGDFLTHAELGLRPTGDPCLRCGLSVFATSDGAVKMYRAVKQRNPKVPFPSFVVELALTPADGVIKQTNMPPHHTWWMYADTNRLGTARNMVKDASDE